MGTTIVFAQQTTATRRVSLEAALEAERCGAECYGAGDYGGAIPYFLEAKRLGLNNSPMIHTGLGTAYMFTGYRSEAVAHYRKAVQLGSRDPLLFNNLVFLQDHEPGVTLEMALEARKAWWQIAGAPLRNTWRPHRNTPDPDRPLRVGYVGGDFRRHSASQTFGPVVMKHTEGYQAICYMTRPEEDDITEIFEGGVKEFHRVAGHDDEQLAARIRDDKIDILVDLAAFSAGGRLSTFCRRPAPVQVTGWGYACGTGLPVMDGFFADEVTVPRALAARGYVEPILYLPSIIPFTTMPYSDPIRPLPCLEGQPFTFGSFNRWMKITPQALDTWAEVLAKTPGSRLLLKEKAYEVPAIQREVLAAMARRGVDGLRVIFRGWSSHLEHLRSYHDVDLALDPFPHSGGVTALEGLWHGVIPITLLGDRVPERLSAALCSALNLRFCITTSRTEYVETAVALATHFQAKLAEIRATLQNRIASSPLCLGYAKAVETHYRDLWRRWCQRQAA